MFHSFIEISHSFHICSFFLLQKYNRKLSFVTVLHSFSLSDPKTQYGQSDTKMIGGFGNSVGEVLAPFKSIKLVVKFGLMVPYSHVRQ